jgi:hypothetical protein
MTFFGNNWLPLASLRLNIGMTDFRFQIQVRNNKEFVAFRTAKGDFAF